MFISKAGPGSSIPGIVARRFGSGTTLIFGTTTTGSVLNTIKMLLISCKAMGLSYEDNHYYEYDFADTFHFPGGWYDISFRIKYN